MKPQINKLASPVGYGDWHDKPLRYEVLWKGQRQLFSTKKKSLAFARLWVKVGDLNEAIKQSVREYAKN